MLSNKCPVIVFLNETPMHPKYPMQININRAKTPSHRRYMLVKSPTTASITASPRTNHLPPLHNLLIRSQEIILPDITRLIPELPMLIPIIPTNRPHTFS